MLSYLHNERSMTVPLYPEIKITRVKHPSRWFAVPLLGGLIKFVLLIPVWIELFALHIATFFIIVIGSFYILFTGKYWQAEYDLLLGLMRLDAKASFYFAGLTNTYPGFSLDVKEFELTIAKPTKPSRMFAFPLLGFFVRLVLLIPYALYSSIMQNAANIALLISWIPVLFGGEYPETTYEIVRDSKRLSFATMNYYAGLSDDYPSFWISMHHKTLKIILIILALLFMFSNFSKIGTRHTPIRQKSLQQYHYQAPQG